MCVKTFILKNNNDKQERKKSKNKGSQKFIDSLVDHEFRSH
jgi:hypothetical protein